MASGIEVTIGTGLLWLVGSPIIPIPTSVVTNGYDSSFTSIKRVLSKSLSCVLKWDAETLKLALCRFQGQNEGLWKISNTIILEIPWFCKSFVMGYINGLMQDCSISSALSIEIVQSYTKPSISSGSHCWSCYLWPILLTWFNFNPSMDK